jgi:hypothetical protein
MRNLHPKSFVRWMRERKYRDKIRRNNADFKEILRGIIHGKLSWKQDFDNISGEIKR